MNNMTKVYLAIPYTGMNESSYEQANQFTVDAMEMGYNPFSPITHSHPLTEFGISQSWDFWEIIDKGWIDVCEEVWVLIPREGMERVHESTGVQAEIEYAKELGLPVKVFEYKNGVLTQTDKNVIKD